MQYNAAYLKQSEVIVHAAHLPVMAAEVVEYLVTRTDGQYIDCTVGAGGHASQILNNAPAGRLLCLDLDDAARDEAKRVLRPFGDRVEIAYGNFADLSMLAGERGLAGVDGVLFDLGFSSMQLDDPGRGFSYSKEGPIDMRLDGGYGPSAKDLIAKSDQRSLAGILYSFGEEHRARPIARAIIAARDAGRCRTTTELAEAVVSTKPRNRTKTLARVFQALRIAVNSELENLRSGLAQAEALLRPGGRIVVISYHSLEDRIVKQDFATAERPCICPRELPVCACGRKPTLRILTRRVVRPRDVEIERNPRARSAKLRAAEKLAPNSSN